MRFTSRKFICSVVAAALGAYLLGEGKSAQDVLTVISPLLAYTGIEGVADYVERGKK